MDKMVIGVAGFGLIGSSFARDLQDKGHGVLCYDNDPVTVAVAMDMGLAHQAATDIRILDDCDAVLIAVPVGYCAEVMRALATLDAPNLKAIFDAGSTKREVVRWAQEELGPYADRFVACHPIAGTEHSGVRNATAGLFAGKRVIMCDPPRDSEAVALTTKLWQECAAQVERMTVAEHDQLFGTISHLPHILVYALVGMLGTREERDKLLDYAAGGFADFTRIANSDARMWSDVCLTNRDNLLDELDCFMQELRTLRGLIADGDGAALLQHFDESRKLRAAMLTYRKQP